FWIRYLPFLSLFEYRHHRTTRGSQVWYELRGERGELLFDCDADICIRMWSNVRTDQWFVDNRQRVERFLRCLQQFDGWENEWPYTISRQPPPPPAGMPPPMYEPSTPTPHTDLEQPNTDIDTDD